MAHGYFLLFTLCLACGIHCCSQASGCKVGVYYLVVKYYVIYLNIRQRNIRV